MTMATYGKVKPFNPKANDWEVYEEQLRFYMVANNITDPAKKRSILLTVCGDHTFKLLRSLVPDGKLDADDITYDSLVGLLKSHYKKKQSVVVHRFNFNTLARKPSESIADYIAALRELAMNCNFGSKERLEEMLRDRLVCGVNHHGIQRKLLSEGDISYTDALALAQSIESAEDDAKKLGGPAISQPVHFTQKGARFVSRTPPTCYRCGGLHLAPVCPHKEKVCRHCKKKGHLDRVCRAKARALAKSDSPATGPPSDKSPKRTHYVQEQPEQKDNSSGDEYCLNTIQDEHSPPFTITLYINDIPVEMEIDTGAAVSIINEATFQRLQQSSCAPTLEPANSKLKTYTGHDIAVQGAAQFTIRYKSTQLYLAVHVVSGTGPNLLGRDLITPLGVDLDNLKEIRSLELASPLQELLDKHAPVFSEGLGCFNGPPVKLKVDANAQPKFYKARSVPFALKSKVGAELADLQSKGIISSLNTLSGPPQLSLFSKRMVKYEYAGIINSQSIRLLLPKHTLSP